MPKLNTVNQYDKNIHFTLSDINNMLSSYTMSKDFNTGYFLKLFSIKPQAQYKQKAKRGRGSYLYSKQEVIEALDFYSKYFEEVTNDSSH